MCDRLSTAAEKTKVLSVASGEKARNEENNYREISIFKNGVTL